MRGLWNRVKRSDGRVPYDTTSPGKVDSYDFAAVKAAGTAKIWNFGFGVCSLNAKDNRKRSIVRLRYSR
jgi:hypothetical protein